MIWKCALLTIWYQIWFSSTWTASRNVLETLTMCISLEATCENNDLAAVMMTSSNGSSFRITGHLCGNSPVSGEIPAQRPVSRGFDVFFDLRPNKRLSKQSRGWWFETSSRPLWRHRNVGREKISQKTQKNHVEISWKKSQVIGQWSHTFENVNTNRKNCLKSK